MAIAFEEIPREFISKVAIYDHKVPITSAVSSINKDGAVLVIKDNEYFGLVDDRSLIRSNLKMPKSLSIGKFARKVPVIDSSTTIEKAILHFYNTGTKALPYYNKNRPAGVLKRDTMLKAMLSLHLVSKYQVRDIMTTPVIAIDASATVAQARSVMQQNKINRLVVLSDNKLFGMLSNKDIISSSVILEKRSPERPANSKINMAKVSEVCERDVKSVEHNVSADDALRTMVENQISSLLVTRDKKPIGLLTVSDIMEAYLAGENVFENNVFVSGLDDYTKQYEEELLEELDRMASKINKFAKFKVSYITLNVKRMKVRNYELKAKVGMGKGGTIAISSEGFSLETALKELDKRIYDIIKQEKEIIVTHKKERMDKYEEE